jgi:hypothetical protein
MAASLRVATFYGLPGILLELVIEDSQKYDNRTPMKMEPVLMAASLYTREEQLIAA